MNLLGKTAPVEHSIQKMNIALNSVGYDLVFSQTIHPLKNCYSVNLASKELPSLIYSNGKGTTQEASEASALGEYIERLQTNNFFIDFYFPNRSHYPDEKLFDFSDLYLTEELLAIYDPNGELSGEDLVDFNSDHTDKIVSLPFIKNSTKEKVYIPQNILSNLYVSNGLATGNTPKEAQIQALSEIFERYVKLEVIKNGYALPHFDEELLRSFSALYADITALREMGFIVDVLDASLGGVFPVTAISLINPKKSSLFVSFGAHPLLEVSLQRTMTELMQGRGVDNLEDFEIPTFDMSLVASSFNLESHFIDSNGKMGLQFLSTQKSFNYCPWIHTPKNTDEEYSYLLELLGSLDKELYIRKYDYLGFYSCQLVVPGFSEVYPIDDLIYNNKNTAKAIRDMVLHPQNYDLEEIIEAVESLDDSQDMQKYLGVIFEHNFTIGEYKAHLFLLCKNYDEALEQLSFGENKLGNLIAELIIMENEGHKIDDYKEALSALFTKERLEKALHVKEGKSPYVDITLHGQYHQMLSMYDKLEIKKSQIV